METPVFVPMVTAAMPPSEPSYVETNHILHLILTLITCGLWAPAWLGVYLVNANTNSGKYKHHQDELAAYRQYQTEVAEYQHQMWLYQQGQQR